MIVVEALSVAYGMRVVPYVPRCLAGCLILHVGLDLVKDAELRWVIRACLLALKEEGTAIDLTVCSQTTEFGQTEYPCACQRTFVSRTS